MNSYTRSMKVLLCSLHLMTAVVAVPLSTLAAVAVTKRTASPAVVVSATDGNVRAFFGGTRVLHIDPEVPYGQSPQRCKLAKALL